MTAAARRAAGEAEFCSCATCISLGKETFRMLIAPAPRADLSASVAWLTRSERDEPLAALLRAHVLWSLLFGWSEP